MAWSVSKTGKSSVAIEGVHGDSLRFHITGTRADWDGWTWAGAVRLAPTSVLTSATLDIDDTSSVSAIDLVVALTATDCAALAPETPYFFDVQGTSSADQRYTILSGQILTHRDVQRP